jgi:hypothetical protein
MVEDGIASEATRKKISKDDAANDDADATALFEVFETKRRIRIGKIQPSPSRSEACKREKKT